MKIYQKPIVELTIIQSDLLRTSVGAEESNDSIGRIPDSWTGKEEI